MQQYETNEFDSYSCWNPSPEFFLQPLYIATKRALKQVIARSISQYCQRVDFISSVWFIRPGVGRLSWTFSGTF